MRKLCIILGFIAALLAVVLAVTPLSNLAIAPAIIAFLSGLCAFLISKKHEQSKKPVQYIFLLIIIAVSITIYKAVFNTVEVGDTQELLDKEKASEEEAIEELEDLDLGDLETE